VHYRQGRIGLGLSHPNVVAAPQTGTGIVFCTVVTLHRMHEMQIIVTNVRSVSLSVCPSVSLSVTRRNSASLCKNG